MFGIGFSELIVVALIGLIFIGPKDLPRIARQLGRFLNDLKHGGDQFINEIKKASPENEVQNLQNKIESVTNNPLDEINRKKDHE